MNINENTFPRLKRYDSNQSAVSHTSSSQQSQLLINAVPVSQSTKQVYNLLIEMITLLYPQEERIPECISFLGLECDAQILFRSIYRILVTSEVGWMKRNTVRLSLVLLTLFGVYYVWCSAYESNIQRAKAIRDIQRKSFQIFANK